LETSTYIDLIENKIEIKQLETAELKSIIERYPYFQSAKALYLKGLKNQDSFKYNNELKITAAYTTNRTMLFDFITSDVFLKVKEVAIHEQITEKIEDEKLPEAHPQETHQIETFQTESLQPKIDKLETHQQEEKDLEIGKPIPFSTNEEHSFGEWLQLSNKKPIERKLEETGEKADKNESIIERFISTNPKIIPVEKGKDISISVSKNKQDSALMTATLAKVYLEQKKYENAIQAYRILSLKYPEKSGYFADQIKKVQILQKNKS